MTTSWVGHRRNTTSRRETVTPSKNPHNGYLARNFRLCNRNWKENMLKRGVIQHSHSLYSAPIVLAKKKDGSWRFCVDYRRLNETSVKDAFPISKIEQTFDALNGAKFFSTLGLASGYWQVPPAPEDRHKSAFVTTDGGSTNS